VTQDAYIRLLKMSFRGTSVGEYRKAMRTCVVYECMDYCRREMEHDKQRAGSLDETRTTDEGDERPRYEKHIAKQERQRPADEEADEAELERLAERRVLLADALARVEDDRKRRVLEMTFDRCSTADIAEELGTSEDNVYQLRRRGLKVLRAILAGEESDSDGDRRD
jgi:RNA polymerase sigma factor (sigma-70 family)